MVGEGGTYVEPIEGADEGEQLSADGEPVLVPLLGGKGGQHSRVIGTLANSIVHCFNHRISLV